MAVIFPTPVGHTLNPAQPAELLQGFINIQNAVGSTNGRVSKSQMATYQQQHANVVDSTTAVANYLAQNFDALANLEIKDNALSVDDLARGHKYMPLAPNISNQAVVQNTGAPATVQSQTGAIPVFIPVPVMIQTTDTCNVSNNGQSNCPAFDAPVAGNPDISQLMLLVLSQMLEMFQSLFTPNSNSY